MHYTEEGNGKRLVTFSAQILFRGHSHAKIGVKEVMGGAS